MVVIDAWGKEGKAPGSLQQKGLERSGTGGSVKGESGSGKKGRDEIVGGKVVAGADVKSVSFGYFMIPILEKWIPLKRFVSSSHGSD